MAKFKLIADDGELEIDIDQKSWHVLDHKYFFDQGWGLRRAFGMDFLQGLGEKPRDKKINTISTFELKAMCKTIWEYCFTSYEDLLSYSYSYEFEKDKGRKCGGGQSGFKVRGYYGNINVTPKGYCTLTLGEGAPNGKGRTVEIIDMRNKKRIETDDWGYLKIHRRRMTIDWYREMPRILEFLDNINSENIEIYYE